MVRAFLFPFLLIFSLARHVRIARQYSHLCASPTPNCRRRFPISPDREHLFANAADE